MKENEKKHHKFVAWNLIINSDKDIYFLLSPFLELFNTHSEKKNVVHHLWPNKKEASVDVCTDGSI